MHSARSTSRPYPIAFVRRSPTVDCKRFGDRRRHKLYIVCLHDGISSDKRDTDSREPTVEAVKRLVPALLERGLRPVTVSRLLI